MIREGDSKPVNHNQPSFLHLPPEIRNQVYSILLKSDGPLVIHFDKLLRLPGYNKPSGLGLLLTCRQIYYEAASTFYANNVKIIGYDKILSVEDHLFYRFFFRATTWMVEKIGCNMRFLNNVTISLDPYQPPCNLGRRRFSDFINVTPLVKALWVPERRFKIEFESTTPAFNTAKLTQVIRTLGDDDLNIKRHELLIGSILVGISGSRGLVQFRSPSKRPYSESRFVALDGGKTL